MDCIKVIDQGFTTISFEVMQISPIIIDDNILSQPTPSIYDLILISDYSAADATFIIKMSYVSEIYDFELLKNMLKVCMSITS